MIRVIKMSGTFYGVEISDDDDDAVKEMAQINIFAQEGTPVIIVGELDVLEELGIDPDSVVMVDREEE